jgi:hypothetical protein
MSRITLPGGLASTVFWPIACSDICHRLLNSSGGRDIDSIPIEPSGLCRRGT